MSDIQSIEFDKYFWTKNQAEEWLKNHKIIPMKVAHITKNYIRYRIEEPNYRYYRVKDIGDGILLTLGFQ